MKRVGHSIVCVVAIAAMLGSGCMRKPNTTDGVIQLEAAVGTIAVSPGSYKALKERISLEGSKTYMKSGDTERVTLTGSASNKAVFETGASHGTARVRIKGSKKFVDKIMARAERITGSSASLTRRALLAETRTYAGFDEEHVAALEEALGKTMTSSGRSRSSFNQAVTITCAFEKGLQGVRLTFSGKNASLRITIEGDQAFVDGIKALVNRTQNPGR